MERDAQLLGRAQAGDGEAFAALVERYRAAVWRLALRCAAGRAEAAEDLAQEAFVRLWDALARIDPARPLFPWLRRVVLNLGAKRAASRSAERRALERLARERAAAPPAPADGIAEAAPELEGRLARAFAALSEEKREILRLRAVEGLSYGEIARALSCAAGTVMSRLHRARAELAERLAQEGHT